MFNYSTGPVELAPQVKLALSHAPPTSHSAEGQLLVAETYRLLRNVMKAPDSFDVVIVPGSIRQALTRVLRQAATQLREQVELEPARCLSIVDGYWGSFMADACRAARLGVVEAPVNDPRAVGLVTFTEMETETGLLLSTDKRRWVQDARGDGAVVVVDAACTAPIHPVDYDIADVVVLGSHKCIGAPAGLGIVLVRKTLELTDWGLAAFRHDARVKEEFLAGDRVNPSHGPPLPTLPIELVNALAASLRALEAEPDLLRCAAAAAAQLREGCQDLGFDVPDGDGTIGATVTRIEIPTEVGSEVVRTRLAKSGFFVIGSIGNGSQGGGFIRVGTMSPPQCDPLNVKAFLSALAEAYRI